tara:strand:- start:222 stop:677 length:456 start_codon:yes stop_codon:yes gene_type:complete
MNKLFPIVLALMCFGFSEPDEVSNFGILPILKFSIEMGQSNTGLGTSFSYGILIGKSMTDDWVDGSYGIYWYKTLSLKNIQNHKTSYGFMYGHPPISNIKFGTKKLLIDETEYIGYELQHNIIILSPNISIYKKNKSKENLWGLSLGLGLF